MASLSGTLATMGPAVPYAIAAKFCHPDRVAIALAGDGAMQMNGINGLITIAKYWEEWSDPRLVVLVLNNRDLNMVTWEQRAMAGDPKFAASQDLPDFPLRRLRAVARSRWCARRAAGRRRRRLGPGARRDQAVRTRSRDGPERSATSAPHHIRAGSLVLLGGVERGCGRPRVPEAEGKGGRRSSASKQGRRMNLPPELSYGEGFQLPELPASS